MRAMDVASIRKGLGLTQAQFAAALGISHKYAGHIETGYRKPSLKLAARIEHVSGTTGLVDAVIAEKMGEAA